MTPELIALLLESSLPVRLALLDAEPTGAGLYVDMDPYMQDPALHVSAESAGLRFLRARIERGDAWLPCNPLAIVRHALKLARFSCVEVDILLTAASVTYRIGRETDDSHKYGNITQFTVAASLEKDGPMWEHTAAVALLREVVGG